MTDEQLLKALREPGQVVLYVVRYWDAQWNELEELSFGNAGPRSAIAGLSTWLAVQEGRFGAETDAFKTLKDVECVTVEVQRG